MITLLILITVTLQQGHTQNNCAKNCQNNNLCLQKCDEYAKNPNRHPLSTPHCGLSRLGANITDYEFKGVGMRNSARSNWPWIASLQFMNSTSGPRKLRDHFCTGIIISDNFILSSAQCVPQEAGGYQVMIGSNSLSLNDTNAQIIEVDSVLIPGLIYKPWVKRHEDFEGKYFENNDILLLKTATKMEPKLKGNDFVINSICFPEPNMYLDYKEEKPLGLGNVVGWGYEIQNEKDLGSSLKAVEVPIISNEMANRILKETRHYFGSEGLYFIYNLTLSKKDLGTMANVPPGNGIIPHWTFNGDKGSSVVKVINGRAFALGVSHWISKGQNPISVWARISYYTKWLEQNMKKNIWQI